MDAKHTAVIVRVVPPSPQDKISLIDACTSAKPWMEGGGFTLI